MHDPSIKNFLQELSDLGILNLLNLLKSSLGLSGLVSLGFLSEVPHESQRLDAYKLQEMGAQKGHIRD